jgi:phage protein D/phage baseplate assembly protein gpV
MSAIALTPLVYLDGRELEASWLDNLVELKVELQFQVPARCRLRFSDPGYGLLRAERVRLGTPVSVSDPRDKDAVLIEAEVTSIEVDQHVGNQPELVVVAQDKSHRLGRGTKVRSYLKMAYSDICAQLASACDLEADVRSTDVVADYLLQADSDLGLLSELARRTGYDWWVEHGALHFMPASATRALGGTVELSFANDLLSFSARASGQRPDAVTVDGWDRYSQEPLSATASSPRSAVLATSELAKLVEHPGAAFGGTTTLQSGAVAAQSQAEADELSSALLDRAAAASLFAVGVVTGTAHLKLGTQVRIEGAGPLSGEYPVTRVEHVFRPQIGFRTRFFSGERQPASLVDTLAASSANRRPAMLHAGLVVGQVTNINDPDRRGRVKVRFPGVSSAEESNWARIVGVGGGAERGHVFVPEVDDEVLVAFEGDDVRQPVVIGGLYGSKSTIPKTTIANGEVQERQIASRLGHVVRLVDGTTPELQAIVLELAGKAHVVHLGKDKLALRVPAGTPIEIVAGDATLCLGKDGSATMKAASVSIKADERISLEAPQVALSADTELNLASQAMAGLKGAVVNVQAEGPLQAKGEPVMIN